jgi:hypothetical protein
VARLFLWLALALALCGGAERPALAEDLTLAPGELVLAAGRALSLGRPEAALAMADALLARDPEDLQALLVKARALRDLGRYEASEAAARRAWELAETEPGKYGAAMAMAQATASDGRRGEAQLWLRRAYEAATTDRQRAIAERDFRYVRARNPLRFRLTAGLAPSSNVNGGSSQDTLTLFGLPFTLSPDAQALSGVQATVSGALSYRILGGGNFETRLGLDAYLRRAWLSAAAQAQAPDAQGRDFDYASLALVLGHEVLGAKPGREYSYELRLGRSWYGHAPLMDYLSLRGEAILPIAGRQRFTLSARGDLQRPVDRNEAALTLVELGGRYRRGFSGGSALTLSLVGQRGFSADATRAYTLAQIGAEYALGQPVLGARIVLGINLHRRDYAVSHYRAAGRHDKGAELYVDLTLEKLSAYGFSPVITLRGRRTRSNIELYSSEEVSLGLSFRSDF